MKNTKRGNREKNHTENGYNVAFRQTLRNIEHLNSVGCVCVCMILLLLRVGWIACLPFHTCLFVLHTNSTSIYFQRFFLGQKWDNKFPVLLPNDKWCLIFFFFGVMFMYHFDFIDHRCFCWLDYIWVQVVRTISEYHVLGGLVVNNFWLFQPHTQRQQHTRNCWSTHTHTQSWINYISYAKQLHTKYTQTGWARAFNLWKFILYAIDSACVRSLVATLFSLSAIRSIATTNLWLLFLTPMTFMQINFLSVISVCYYVRAKYIVIVAVLVVQVVAWIAKLFVN